METSNPVVVADGFDADAADPTTSTIRGINIKFKDGDYYAYSDKLDVRERAFVVIDRQKGWQKLARECSPEYLMWKAGEPRPPRPLLTKRPGR